MTAEEIKVFMDDQARNSARDVIGTMGGELPNLPEGLPEPGLWTEDEFEAVYAETSLAAAATPRPVPLAIDVPNPDEPPVDLTDPLAHIRKLILPDCPEAATATDEELELLFDQWAAKHEE